MFIEAWKVSFPLISQHFRNESIILSRQLLENYIINPNTWIKVLHDRLPSFGKN